MQTFLAYKSFSLALSCLDYKRLGKQRVEAKQILDILEGRSLNSRWINHPTVRMWKGYEQALHLYKDLAIKRWVALGYKNTMLLTYDGRPVIYPPWITEKFCAAHRSNLLRKNPAWYSQFGWTEPNNLPYIWPV